MEFETIFGLIDRSVKMFADETLILEKENGGDVYLPTTYAQIKEQARQFGAALVEMGVKPGERIAMMAEGSRRWLVAELGILYARAINVPLSIKLDVKSEVKFRIEHAEATRIILSWTQADRMAANMDMFSFSEVITFAPSKIAGAIEFDSLLERGKKWLENDENARRFEALTASIKPDDVVNIQYTSGTTADPKGIMLTHGNYASNTLQSCSIIKLKPKSVTLTLLPWDHSFAHTTCLYCMMYYGGTVATPEIGKTAIETLKNIPKNIKEVRPTILMSVPALSKAFKNNIQTGVKKSGKIAEWLFNFTIKCGIAYNGNGRNTGKGWRMLLWPFYKFGDVVVLRKVREGFGGRLEQFIGGGALLDVDLQKFFAAVGMPIMQGYGLSEASPVISANSLTRHKFGSSGNILHYLDLKICDSDGNEVPKGDKGEIVIKGGNVMKGYWKNPESTADTIKGDWLHTGDMGYIDPEGLLYVLGRFKSLLISSDGEKYSPEGIEESMVELLPSISQVMLYNNQSPFTVALVVPNINFIKSKLDESGLSLGTEEGCRKACEIVWNDVCQMRKGGLYGGIHPDRWLPTSVGILPEAFTEQNHLLNSTMKLVRGKVVERYGDLIAGLFGAKGTDIVANIENLGKWAK